MSFKNTHTLLRSEITGKARYQLPKHKVHGQVCFYFTPELEAHFRRLYPVTMNRDMMRMFGISFSVMQRFKRKMGLEKKMQTIRHKQAELTKKICEANGYYDSIRGKALSEAAMEAVQQLRATGWNPWVTLKKDKKRYNRVCRKLRETRHAIVARDRLRINMGLEPIYNLNLPYDPYGRKRIYFRNMCKTAGYIPGDARKQDERWTIFYDENTKRGEIREKHGIALGFTFKPQNAV